MNCEETKQKEIGGLTIVAGASASLVPAHRCAIEALEGVTLHQQSIMALEKLLKII